MRILAEDFLPADRYRGTLVGRAWLPGNPSGPAVVALRADGVFDLSSTVPTMSDLLEMDHPATVVRAARGRRAGSLDELLASTVAWTDGADAPRLLAPCDLQVIKAAGVTFVSSMLERVIEERAGGDLARAADIRIEVEAALGGGLADLRPGSQEAMCVKDLLIARGMWSQYLEVGIGPDAEVFTKAPVLSAAGTGAEVGVHPASRWNNPEPEVVLAVNSRGSIQGAALGNDVNLRDFEGRSALLLGKAKDNNGSCAIGPFFRLFDDTYSLADLRQEELELRVEGTDGYVLCGASSMRAISREPADLVAQTICETHQYPDGLVLFLGTLFAPSEDRDLPGQGFTHKAGDIVSIRSPGLGTLRNRVNTSDRVSPWTFGIRELMTNLVQRGLIVSKPS